MKARYVVKQGYVWDQWLDKNTFEKIDTNVSILSECGRYIVSCYRNELHVSDWQRGKFFILKLHVENMHPIVPVLLYKHWLVFLQCSYYYMIHLYSGECYKVIYGLPSVKCCTNRSGRFWTFYYSTDGNDLYAQTIELDKHLCKKKAEDLRGQFFSCAKNL
jgi:hypothetical protein